MAIGYHILYAVDLLQKSRNNAIGPRNFAIVRFGPPRTGTTRPAVEVPQIGITPELADLLQGQVADSIDELARAQGAVGAYVLQGGQVVLRHDRSELRSVGVNTSGRWISLKARRGLFHAEAIGPGMGDIDPRQHRDLQAALGPSVTAVPEAVEPRGLFATFGNEARIEGQGLFMIHRHDRQNSGCVQGNKVKGPGKLSSKSLFVIGTVAAQVSKVA